MLRIACGLAATITRRVSSPLTFTICRGAPVKVYPPEKIRNVALVGHSGAGKTTLAEALLYRAGTVSRLGRVEDGNTVTDFDPEEHERGFSLSLALAPFEWHGHKINIIDTPGSPDFVADVYACLLYTSDAADDRPRV